MINDTVSRMGSRMGAQWSKAALASSIVTLISVAGCGNAQSSSEIQESSSSALTSSYESEMSTLDQDGIRPLETLGPFITADEVRTHVRNAGFPNSLVETLVRIARCESSFGINSYAWGGGNRHTGLFQISDLHRASCGYSTLDGFRNSLTDPAKNARCAYVVYVDAGYSLTPWDCY
jgi:hypothetical protein